MAVFEQRESGWWQAKIRRKGFPSQSKTFRTKLDAQVWARGIDSGIDKGTHVSTAAAENTLFKDLAARFSTEFAAFHYRGMGWKHKLAHLVDRFGNHSVASLTADKIALYRDQRLTDPDPRFSDAKKSTKNFRCYCQDRIGFAFKSPGRGEQRIQNDPTNWQRRCVDP